MNMVDAARAQRSLGLRSPALTDGDPAMKHFDLVVIGTHGHSAFVDAMMGGTARRVLRRCKKPVLTVRVPKAD